MVHELLYICAYFHFISNIVGCLMVGELNTVKKVDGHDTSLIVNE